MKKTYVAKSLVTLTEQLNRMFPARSKVSDGAIGDLKHSKRKSDHNPNAYGAVTALDITFDRDPSDGVGVDCNLLLAALLGSKDDRIKYIIFDGFIYNERDGFARRKYTGPNAHRQHLHLSVKGDPKLFDDPAPWHIQNLLDGRAPAPPPAPPRDLKRGDSGDSVRELQNRLHLHNLLKSSEIDGQFGPKTEAAVKAFQLRRGLRPDGIVGQNTRKELNL